MEPTVIVRIEYDDTIYSYELGAESDKEILGLIQKYGALVSERPNTTDDMGEPHG